MTEEQLVAIAKEAGFAGVRTRWFTVHESHQILHNTDYKQLARFAKIIEKRTMQRCAAIARNYPFSPNIGIGIAESILKEDTK